MLNWIWFSATFCRAVPSLYIALCENWEQIKHKAHRRKANSTIEAVKFSWLAVCVCQAKMFGGISIHNYMKLRSDKDEATRRGRKNIEHKPTKSFENMTGEFENENDTHVAQRS